MTSISIGPWSLRVEMGWWHGFTVMRWFQST